MVINLTDRDSYYANTYLFISNGEAILIDASAKPIDIENQLIQNNAKLKYIVLTHGHYDHVIFLDEIRDYFKDVKVICGNAEDLVLTDMEANVSTLFGDPKVYAPADITVSEGDVLKVGESEFEILQTPGHTIGSICLLDKKNKLMFTGDTLFAGGIGRTDFKYGSYDEIRKSLSRLASLDESIVFYSGHGDSGILGWEF